MEKEDLLKQKREVLESAVQRYKMLNQDIHRAVSTFFAKLNEGIKPVIQVREGQVDRRWASFGMYSKDEQFEYRCTVEFVDSEGKRDLDFGSTFDLKITNKRIEINKGTCGSYTREDACQVGRDLLLGKLWLDESDLVDIFSMFDCSIIDEKDKAWNEVSNIEREIRAEKDAAERASLMDQLRKAKYIYSVGRTYNRDTKKYEHYLSSAREIVKITDKSVITMDVTEEGKHYSVPHTTREKLGFIIGSLKAGTIFLSDKVGRYKEVVGVSN